MIRHYAGKLWNGAVRGTIWLWRRATVANFARLGLVLFPVLVVQFIMSGWLAALSVAALICFWYGTLSVRVAIRTDPVTESYAIAGFGLLILATVLLGFVEIVEWLVSLSE